jgi:hypothetical protein
MAGLVSALKGRSSGHEALAALSVLSWPSVRTSRPNIRERLLVIQRHWYGICCCNPFESSRNEEAHKASHPTRRKLSEVRSRHKMPLVTDAFSNKVTCDQDILGKSQIEIAIEARRVLKPTELRLPSTAGSSSGSSRNSTPLWATICVCSGRLSCPLNTNFDPRLVVKTEVCYFGCRRPIWSRNDAEYKRLASVSSASGPSFVSSDRAPGGTPSHCL